MKYPAIRLEGPILSQDIIDRIAEGDHPGQEPSAFGLDGRVKDEIARAWADARALWGMFERRRSHPAADDRLGTRGTRSAWVLPLLGLLGYELEYQREAPEIAGRKYPVSHKAVNRGDLPVHVIGNAESLDERESRAMSAHSLVQEYLNLSDLHLYALVTNGLRLRLLRDASRLVRLSFVEFDLERMMGDGLYADFAVFYRILHASRMPRAPRPVIPVHPGKLSPGCHGERRADPRRAFGGGRIVYRDPRRRVPERSRERTARPQGGGRPGGGRAPRARAAADGLPAPVPPGDRGAQPGVRTPRGRTAALDL